MSILPANLRLAELLPGCRVVVVGLTNATQYNAQCGDVLSWQGDRWIVELDSEELKSFRSGNLVILPEAVVSKKRKAEELEVETKKLSPSDLKDFMNNDETIIARAFSRCIREYPLLAQKCICCLATKSTG